MTNKTISELTPSVTVDAEDLVPIVHGGANEVATVEQIRGSLEIPDNFITTGMIANDNVTPEKIPDQSITGGKLANGTVINAKLASMAATSIKANATVTNANATDFVVEPSTVVGRGASGAITALTMGTGMTITGGALATTAAPSDPEFLVANTEADLPNSRVATNSTTITKNIGTTGQIAFERAALTGHVTSPANSNETTIADNVVTNAMQAAMAANTIKVNNTASPAAPSDLAVPVSTVVGRDSSGNIVPLTMGSGMSITGGALVSSGGTAGQYGFNFTYSNSTTMGADPGIGLFRFNVTDLSSGLTTCTIDNSTNDAVNALVLNGLYNIIRPGMLMYVQSKGDTSYLLARITTVVDSSGYRTITLTRIGSSNFTDGESCVVMFISAANVEYDATTGNFLVNGVDVSAPLTLENLSDLPTAAAGNIDYVAAVRVPIAQEDTNVRTFPMVVRSNSSEWQQAASTVIAQLEEPILPVATNVVTWTVANNGSGFARLTANVAHGLTAGSTHAGKHLIVKTTQNGWVALDPHTISDVPTSTTVDLTTPIGSLGVPVFYAKAEVTPICRFNIPSLKSRSKLDIDTLWEHTGSTNSKRLMVFFSDALSVTTADEYLNVNQTTAADIGAERTVTIRNTNNTSVQRGTEIKTFAASGGSYNSALPTTAKDTLSPTMVTLAVNISTANEYAGLLGSEVGLLW